MSSLCPYVPAHPPMEEPHCSQNSSKGEHRAPPGGESRYCIPSQQSSLQDTGHIRCTHHCFCRVKWPFIHFLMTSNVTLFGRFHNPLYFVPPLCQIDFEIISKFGFLPTFSRQTDMGRARTSICLSPTWETRRGQGQSHLFPGCYSSSSQAPPQLFPRMLSWVRRYVYIFFWIFQNMN